MTEMIRILIADDHPIIRDGLTAVFSTQPDFEVVGEAGNGADAVRMVVELNPDVVLLDLEMPEMDGVEALSRMRETAPNIAAIVFTAFDTDERILSAIRAGARGYLLKGTPREELPQLVYPLAEYRKSAARQLAERTGLITWDKPDSQEVCFVPKDYRDFLLPRLGGQMPPAGDFVDRAGRILGRHQGIAHYTVGQRRGLGLGNPAPLYVVELNVERNEVVLGPEEELFSSAMTVSGLNWVSRLPPEAPLEVVAKIRYSHAGSPARLLPLGAERARVEFHAPVRAITPGQAAAFYDGDVLLGGGWIDGRGEAEAS